MADSTPNLVLDPDDVIFDADGNVESMTDPDTGEKVTSDPKPATSRDPDGPYDGIDGDGNEESDPTAGRSHAAAGELDPVLADTLALYGLVDEAGVVSDTIEWNGEETRVRDLSPEDRREFLAELREQDRQEAAGTTAEEQELLDFLRQGGDLREALGLGPAAGPGAVAALSADEVNRADIRQQYPRFTDQEVDEELADRKLSNRYEAKTGQIRERLTTAEQAAVTQAEQADIAQERTQIIQSAEGLKEILGFPIAPEVRAFLVARVADQEANGQTAFMNSLTPEKALRLQFLDTYADSIDQHYKAEIAAAHKRGRSEALRGAPTSPGGRSGSAGNAGSGSARPQDDKKYLDYTLGE